MIKKYGRIGLASEYSKLIASQIEDGLGTRRVGRSVLCFDEVDSTNDVAWDSARQGNTDGLVISAESQRAGRGRHGRKWLSPPSANILLSVVLLDPVGKLPQEAVTIAAGLSAAEAVVEATCLDAELKWPNDVLVYGSKIAGVIVEATSQAGCQSLVVGIGLNVFAAPPANTLSYPATSLAEHIAEPLSRAAIVRGLLQKLDHWIDAIESSRIDELHEAWLSRCGMLNDRVHVTSAGKEYVGRVLDVDPLRGLLISDDNGSRVYIPAAGATITDAKKDSE